MIEVTIEMERAMYGPLAAAEPGRHHAAVRAGLAAVLAIVERDQTTAATGAEYSRDDELSLSDIVAAARLAGMVPGTGRFSRAILGAGYRRIGDPSPDWELRDHFVTAADPSCPRCASPRWVAVSLDQGHTRRRQCVPCGAIWPGVIKDETDTETSSSDYEGGSTP